jgi:hypothetical protein
MNGTSVLKRTVTIALVVVVALAGTACSDDDDETVEGDATTTTEDEREPAPVTTIADEEFSAATESFTAGVDAAGEDFCAVVQAASANAGPAASPGNSEQVRQTVEMQVNVMESLAATTPVDEENAATLRRTAEELTAAAEEDGYSTDFLSSDAAGEILMGEDFQRALQAYSARASEECANLPGASPPESGDEVLPEGAPIEP